MKQIKHCFKSLETAGFLKIQAVPSNATLPDIQLLPHGKAYAAQLQQQWLNLRNLAVHLGSTETPSNNNENRLSFVQSQQLRKHVQQLRQQQPRKAKCPTLLKHQQCLATGSTAGNTLYTHQRPITQLVTDFFVEPHRALEHFYNMQRESKIWWMRYSTNPSRYAIEAHDVQQPNCQAIDIKSAFGQESITVEQLTLAPLPPDSHFEMPDARTGKTLVPHIIRSAIELEPATCALLLDGCDHGRGTESLLLNRVLAPYQCAIACLEGTAKASPDLHDLCTHLTYVLQRAGLRLCQAGEAYAHNVTELSEHMQLTDKLGVPYALLLDEQTLQQGLLQLRNRDTKLAETIHISDMPDYLLNILRN